MKDMILKAYVNTSTALQSFFKKEDGVTAIEYAIVVAGIAAVVLVVFGTGGPIETAITDVFTKLKTKLGTLLS